MAESIFLIDAIRRTAETKFFRLRTKLRPGLIPRSLIHQMISEESQEHIKLKENDSASVVQLMTAKVVFEQRKPKSRTWKQSSLLNSSPCRPFHMNLLTFQMLYQEPDSSTLRVDVVKHNGSVLNSSFNFDTLQKISFKNTKSEELIEKYPQ